MHGETLKFKKTITSYCSLDSLCYTAQAHATCLQRNLPTASSLHRKWNVLIRQDKCTTTSSTQLRWN